MDKKKWNGRPLFQLIPAAVVAGVIGLSLPLTMPTLAAIPERLSAPEPEAETDAAEDTLLDADVPLLPYADGTYEGEAQGYGGLIRVRVTMSGGRITDIEILDASGETASFFNRAKKLVDTVLERQTWEVDTVSGATYSSKGILGAIQNALTGQAVQNEAPKKSTPAPLSAEVFETPAAYADGVYTGSATGFGGTITVQVTIADGKIADISIVSAPGETPSYFNRAKAVVSSILSSGSPNVDTVSGATYSSTGIINAVKRALSQAAVGGSAGSDLTIAEPAPQPEPEPVPVLPANPDARPAEEYRDGVYIGSGEGYGGEITVQVTVSGGRITAIDVLSAANETEQYFSRARVMLTNMLAAQSTEVDAVSGATYSSEGLREAVNDALSQAKVTPDPEPTPDPTPEPTPEPDPEPGAVYLDGTYTGTAQGYGGDITVELTVAEQKISEVRIVSAEGEDEDHLSAASALTEEIVSRQSAAVDVVSGATESSSGILAASRQALAQAEETPELLWQDGTYSAQVRCTDDDVFDYLVQVDLDIHNGVITHLSAQRQEDVSENPDDNESYFQSAVSGRTVKKVWYKGVVGQVLAKQSAEVDTVSRATYSSNAILEGVRQALAQAGNGGEEVS